MRSASREAIDETSRADFAQVRVRGIGDQIVVLSLHISDLRQALGLPDHALFSRGIFHNATFERPSAPVEQADVDHEDFDNAYEEQGVL